jgi:glycosyltransferase involved in cell wall biosynthesis
MKSKILYIAKYNKDLFPGVHQKIQQTVHALQSIGHETDQIIVEKGSKFELIHQFSKAIYKSDADIIIIRSDAYMPLYLFAVIKQRLRGCRIVVDVPTPLTNVLIEIDGAPGAYLKKLKQKISIRLAFPWSLWFVDKVIHYAPESKYFSFGIKDKIHLTANGISIDKIPQRKIVPTWPSSQFIMIGVASLADWHAFDRVIHGISNYLSENPNSIIRPKLVIVGDGDARKSWQELVLRLGLQESVTFTGYKSGADLECLYEAAHVAISSLGLYRINLETASVLKSREYSARGIPFVKAGFDIDFNPVPNFVFDVNNSSEPLVIGRVIEWYNKICTEDIFDKARSYAVEKLEFTKKVNELIKF